MNDKIFVLPGRKKLIGIMAIIIIFSCFPVNVNASISSEYLTLKDQVIRENSPVTIEVFNLNATSEYKINWTTNDIGKTFTATGENTMLFLLMIKAPSSINSITIYLRDSEGTRLDSLTAMFMHSSGSVFNSFFAVAPVVLAFILFAGAITVLPVYFLRRGR